MIEGDDFLEVAVGAPTPVQVAAEALGASGWAVIEDFLPPSVIRSLALGAAGAEGRGEFDEAGIGRSDEGRLVPATRGDSRLWLDPSAIDGLPAEASYWAAIEGLRLAVNEALFLGALDVEAHYARYAPGAVYGRHVDQLSGSTRRAVSTVLYLNEDWGEGDGGALRLWLTDTESSDTAPAGGRLVLFASERFEHEVLASRRERWSITAWMRRRAA